MMWDLLTFQQVKVLRILFKMSIAIDGAKANLKWNPKASLTL